jgi:aerobic-type carbon monoxide dehydrogenase small subunit (CoxS/CutS family)
LDGRRNAALAPLLQALVVDDALVARTRPVGPLLAALALVPRHARVVPWARPHEVRAGCVKAHAAREGRDRREGHREALQPHLCRCTGYVRYYAAVKDLVLNTPGLTLKG